MPMTKKLWNQIIRFVVTGVINTAIDIIILNILIHVSGRGSNGIWYGFFATISFIFAATNSYFMNKYWTFSGLGTKNRKIEVSEFLIVTVFGLVVNVVIASLVVNLVAPGIFPYIPVLNSHAVLWPSIGKLCGTAVGLVMNFLGYKFVVFEKKAA